MAARSLHGVVPRDAPVLLLASHDNKPPSLVVRPLKGLNAFSDVLRSGRKTTSGPLLLTAVSSAEANTRNTLFCGVTIGRRTAKRAVVRNRVKRLLRESIRQILPVRSGVISELGIHTLVLVWRSAPEAPGLLRLSDVRAHVAIALDHAITVCRKHAKH